jgi:hypothetical protein
LDDLIVGFYSNTTSAGTVYIDDVVFEEAIATPTANAASAVDKYSFTANWAAVTGAASYQLDVSTNNTFTAILSSYNNLSVSGTSQVVSTGLSDNTTYYYRVRAVSNAGTATSSSSTISTTTLSDPSLVKDGSFTSAAVGNFTLGTTAYVNSAYTRNAWGGVNTATGDAALPVMGVTSGGYAGNCGFFTRGTTQPSVTTSYLFQRLSATPGMSATKTYKLSMKLKSGATASNGLFYIRNRAATKFALRDNIISGGSDTYTWCKATGNIPATWTDYSQSFVFSNSLSGSVISTTQPSLPEVAFTDAELNDLVVCFYSTTANGTVYIDDVTLEENTTPAIFGAAIGTAFTTTYGTASAKQDFPVSGRYLSSDITATAPTGFEVASDGATFGSTATIALSGSIASGTISVRLKANAAVSGTYNSQNIVLSSNGATSVNIVTAASGNAVAPKVLTIGSASIASKVYDGSTTSGTVTPGSLSGFVGSETVTISSATGTYADANVGTGKSATIVYTLGNGNNGGLASNYSLANGSGTGTITAATLTLNNAATIFKASDYTIADLANSDLVVSAGEFNADRETNTVHSITVAPGAKLTLNSSKTLTTGSLTLQSDVTGTGTFVDENTDSGLTVTGTASVQQWLTGLNGTSHRGLWYISCPVSAATAAVFDVAAGTNKMTRYDETKTPNPGYVTQFTDNATLLTPGVGYVAQIGGVDAAYTFSTSSGSNTTKLNTGAMPITVTRTGTTAAKRGFNLVGNPYPSYLDWKHSSNTKTNLRSTIWYRVYDGSQMTFDTYDGTTGTGNGVKGAVSQYIPPIQAFWVKVDKDGDVATLAFANAARLHRDQSLAVNSLRAPAQKNTEPQIVRLRVSNGTNSDETILVADANATDAFDTYDSEKMNNDNAAIPEIYTLAGTQELVINHLSDFATNKQIALGFRPGTNSSFSIVANEISNVNAQTKVILIDKLQNNAEFDLTNETAYTFSADATPTADRFVIAFRAPGVATNLSNANNVNMFVYKNANNQITINRNSAEEGIVTVCNAIGQKLVSMPTTGTNTVIRKSFCSGVYFVTVNAAGNKSTQKVIIN